MIPKSIHINMSMKSQLRLCKSVFTMWEYAFLAFKKEKLLQIINTVRETMLFKSIVQKLCSSSIKSMKYPDHYFSKIWC